MARHSKHSSFRSWVGVLRQLLVALTRVLSSWAVLVLVSIAPGVLVGGLGYLLLNDITADVWLSAIVSVLAALLVAVTSLLALSRLQGKGAFRLE